MSTTEAPAPQTGRQRAASHLPVICLTLLFFITSWNTRERPLVLFVVPVLLVIFARNVRKPIAQPTATAILVAALAILGYDMLSPRAIGQGQPDGHRVDDYARLMNLVWIVLGAALLYFSRRSRKVGWRWSVGIIAVASVLSAGLILVTPEPGIDVWHLHQEAGEALFNGENPYADIRVFASSEVGEEARLMTGYPYTPPNLAVFGSSAELLGDSRWLSLASWIAFLTLFAVMRPKSPASTALLLFLACQPGWHVVLEIAYTETVTLLLLAAAIVAWKHRRTLGPLLLGAALATKQYLVVLAPMVAAMRFMAVRSRAVTLGTALVTAAIGAAWGVAEYFDAVVAYHLRVPPQGHSLSLYGMTYFFEAPFVIPSIVGLAASVLVGLISARTARTASQILLGAATALGVGFFLATQAYANYWFLVGCLVALSFLYANPQPTKTLSDSKAETVTA